jgi:outer membrane protein assembly factor BamE (lipoprotein component of BamABCDE complex)
MRNYIFFGLIASALMLSACTWEPDLSDIGLPRVHKIDIPQGNVVEQYQINQLRPGMNKEQVRFVMGTPMINDVFHTNRWDYLYRFKPGYGETKTRLATLYFNEQDKLASIQGDYRPGEKAEKERAKTDLVVVPLRDFDDDGLDDEDKSYWRRFWNFFAWTEEHEGISKDDDIPVNRQGEGETGKGDSDIY